MDRSAIKRGDGGADTRPAGSAPAGRLTALDVARGLTIVWMVAYHVVWDLTFFGVLTVDLLGSFFWWVQPQIITTLFMTWVGAGCALAGAAHRPIARYLRRTGWIALAAAAITAATLVAFPDSYIFFGVLHCIAVASLIGLAVRRLPGWVLALAGAAFVAAPQLDWPDMFDRPALIWLGLADRTPLSNDFVPLMPYAGAMFFGLLLGRWLATRHRDGSDGLRPAGVPAVAWMGRHSLAIYLVHQPVLLGSLFAVHHLTGLMRPNIMNIVG